MHKNMKLHDLYYMLKLIYAEFQIVIKSHTYIVIPYFKTGSEKDEALF